MKVRRIVAPNMRLALEQVRERLGEDALILEKQKHPDGIELFVAEPGPSAALPAQKNNPAAQTIRTPANPKRSSAGRSADSFNPTGSSLPISDEWWQQLLPQLSTQSSLKTFAGLLSQSLAYQSRDLAKVDCCCILGCSGAGKTALIAKIACRHINQYGNDSVAIISLDNQRFGASQQLKAMGQLLKIPCFSLRRVADWKPTLAKIDSRRLILIDSPGTLQSTQIMQQHWQAIKRQRRCASLLCLPAYFNSDMLQRLCSRYQAFNLQGINITFTDECQDLLPVINLAVAHKLPIYFGSKGGHQINDLIPADASWIEQNILTHWRQSFALEPNAKINKLVPQLMQEKPHTQTMLGVEVSVNSGTAPHAA